MRLKLISMQEFDTLTRNTRPRSRRRLIGLAVVVMVLVGIGVTMGTSAFVGENSRSEQGGASEDAGLLEQLSNVSGEPQNVLVMGVDERPERGSEVEGTRADTIMLVRVYPDTGRIKVLSVPRDLLVEVEPGVWDKINASYAYNGASGTISALEELTGTYVDHYAVVDFVGFEEIIDSMGGVRMDVDEEVVPSQWNMGEGVQRLNGRRALIYARIRSTEGGDLDRIRRQQEVLAALRSQAFKWRSVKKFPEITHTLVENIETDLSVVETASLGKTVGRHGRGALMTSTQLKGIPDTLDNGSEVLVPDEEANAAILREFLD